MVRICFVCLGNICRSPTAEGVMKRLIEEAGLQDRIVLDSAGTSAFHVGEPPDRRSQEVARARGIVLEGAARQFRPEDFDRFDYVVAMDRSNHRALEALIAQPEARAKLHMLRSFDTKAGEDLDVPDPYFGGGRGFDRVLDICTAGCRGLLERIRRDHSL